MVERQSVLEANMIGLETLESFYARFPMRLDERADRIASYFAKWREASPKAAATPAPATRDPSLLPHCWEAIGPRLREDADARARAVPDLNIFDAAGMGHHELRHCSFLAWLLDPRSTHAQGGLFMRCLAEAAALQLPFDPAKDTFCVKTEGTARASRRSLARRGRRGGFAVAGDAAKGESEV